MPSARRRKKKQSAHEETAHEELYLSTRSDEIIRMSCRCELGRDHTYSEWRTLVAQRPAARSASPSPVLRLPPTAPTH